MAKNLQKEKYLPSKANVEEFEIVQPILLNILREMREFSKKKQDGSLNKFKVRTINKVLEKIKALLENEPTIEFLELLDDETLPTNSDAVMLVIQFSSALEQFRSKYFTQEGDMYGFSAYVWKTRD